MVTPKTHARQDTTIIATFILAIIWLIFVPSPIISTIVEVIREQKPSFFDVKMVTLLGVSGYTLTAALGITITATAYAKIAPSKDEEGGLIEDLLIGSITGNEEGELIGDLLIGGIIGLVIGFFAIIITIGFIGFFNALIIGLVSSIIVSLVIGLGIGLKRRIKYAKEMEYDKEQGG